MKTLKYLIGAAASVAVLAMGGSAFAAIEGSMHDLTDATGGASDLTTSADNQYCSFCHTPHSNGTLTPLWNRAEKTSGTYTMYTSATIAGAQQTDPVGVSAACLSCHDGVTALDVMYNAPTLTSGTYRNLATAATQTYTWSLGDGAINPAVVVGTDLSNDHPISITYGADSAMETLANIQLPASGLTLYGGSNNQVECGTCHNPHDPTNVPFLRIDNTGSALCMTCHIDK